MMMMNLTSVCTFSGSKFQCRWSSGIQQDQHL